MSPANTYTLKRAAVRAFPRTSNTPRDITRVLRTKWLRAVALIGRRGRLELEISDDR